MNYFYQPEVTSRQYLEEDEFQHCVKVLRSKTGDRIGILDGKGGIYEAVISSISKNQCAFEIWETQKVAPKSFHCHLAIAPTKNADRMEWMVEKCCELGVDEITFIQTGHSERSKLKTERLVRKAISALKQSRNGYITQVNPLVPFSDLLASQSLPAHRYVAVVREGLPYFSKVLKPNSDTLILIGPEGDFSEDEVRQAEKAGFVGVSLGNSVLRTETAGLMACHFVNMMNDF